MRIHRGPGPAVWGLGGPGFSVQEELELLRLLNRQLRRAGLTRDFIRSSIG
jgi:hypothetical protein